MFDTSLELLKLRLNKRELLVEVALHILLKLLVVLLLVLHTRSQPLNPVLKLLQLICIDVFRLRLVLLVVVLLQRLVQHSFLQLLDVNHYIFSHQIIECLAILLDFPHSFYDFFLKNVDALRNLHLVGLEVAQGVLLFS